VPNSTNPTSDASLSSAAAAKVVEQGPRKVVVSVYPVQVVERFLKELRKTYCQQGKRGWLAVGHLWRQLLLFVN